MADRSFSPFAALRHRNYRLFWTGQAISLTGTWMQSLAQGWLVLQLTNSAFWVGFVSFVGSVPALLFSLPAGVYVDRADKRRVVMICQALFLLEAAVLTVLTALRAIAAWQVALLAGLVGLISSMEIPARQAMIVELVGKEDLTNAIALNSSAFNATRIVGPAIAGILVAKLGIAVCFGLNALSYVAVLYGLYLLRMPAHEPPERIGGGLERFREGLAFVRAQRGVFALLLNTALLAFLASPFLVLLPVFARDVLKVGADGLGLMSAFVGLGAVGAALGLAALAPIVHRGRLLRRTGPLFGLSVALFGVVQWYPAALAALALAGFGMILNNAVTNTLLQGLVPDALRGRVMSLWSLVFVGFAPIGALEAGWLASRIGADAAVAIGGVVSAATAWWIWRRVAPEVVALR